MDKKILNIIKQEQKDVIVYLSLYLFVNLFFLTVFLFTKQFEIIIGLLFFLTLNMGLILKYLHTRLLIKYNKFSLIEEIIIYSKLIPIKGFNYENEKSSYCYIVTKNKSNQYNCKYYNCIRMGDYGSLSKLKGKKITTLILDKDLKKYENNKLETLINIVTEKCFMKEFKKKNKHKFIKLRCNYFYIE